MKKKNNILTNQETYITQYKQEQRFVSILRVLIFVLFLAVWETLSNFEIIDSFFLVPHPAFVCYL